MHRRPMGNTAGVCSITYGLISSSKAIPCDGGVDNAHTGPFAVLKQIGSADCSTRSMSPVSMSFRPMRSAAHPVSASQRAGPWLEPPNFDPHCEGSKRIAAAHPEVGLRDRF